MGFIPQITCRHCGKKFSAIHSRCPNCGTRHVKQTSRSTPTTDSVKPGTAASARADSNTRWQFIFGCILVAAVIVAVIVLISASLSPKEPEKPVETPPVIEVTTPPPTTPPPTDTPEPTVGVTSVTIVTSYDGRQATEFTLRSAWGPIQLRADVYPTEALTTATVEWRSSNDEVCTVDDTGLVTAVGSGRCEIIAECGGIGARCVVLVP